MKVNVDFNITILDGPEAGRSFKGSYIDETRPRPGFNGSPIEELIMKWSYMPPYQRMDDFKEVQNDKQKCCSNCKFGDDENAPICDECDYLNSKWEPKEQIINELANKLEQIENKYHNDEPKEDQNGDTN